MSTDVADTLRALARDHLDGRSSRETYRRLRAQLLDGLIAPAAGASPDATQPRAAAPLAEVTQPRAASPRATVERCEAPPGDEPKSRRVSVTGFAALGLLLTTAVVYLAWRHHSRGPASSPASVPTSSETSTAGTDQADPVRALLEPLLQNPDWSDARVLALNEALLEAGQSRLDAARNTDWFDVFVASVRSRLRRQQALAGAPLTPDSSPLAALAVTLGIDLSAPAQPGELKRSAEPAKRAQDAIATKTTPRGKSAAALATAPASRSASVEPARPTRRVANTKPVLAEAGSPPAITAAAASAPAARNQAKTATAHEYPACAAALSQVRLNYCQDFLASGSAGPLLAVLPSGSFMMGNGALAQEGPPHRVTLSYGFAMSVYEVSQSDFQLYCRAAGKACPEQPWTRGDYPVVNVSWRDAQDYARWLSLATHQRYRLPTEAEWEYAARAGSEGLYPSGDSLSPTDAYFSMGSTLTAPAPRSMRFNANAWHLMHMVGNAREWVADAWSPTLSGAPVDGSARVQGESGVKVVRGGCYADPAIKLRLTTREPLPADTRDRCTGIRLVRELPR